MYLTNQPKFLKREKKKWGPCGRKIFVPSRLKRQSQRDARSFCQCELPGWCLLKGGANLSVAAEWENTAVIDWWRWTFVHTCESEVAFIILDCSSHIPSWTIHGPLLLWECWESQLAARKNSRTVESLNWCYACGYSLNKNWPLWCMVEFSATLHSYKYMVWIVFRPSALEKKKKRIGWTECCLLYLWFFWFFQHRTACKLLSGPKKLQDYYYILQLGTFFVQITEH